MNLRLLLLCILLYSAKASCRDEGKTWNGTDCEYNSNSIVCKAQEEHCGETCSPSCRTLKQLSKERSFCLNNCRKAEWKNDCFKVFDSTKVNYLKLNGTKLLADLPANVSDSFRSKLKDSTHVFHAITGFTNFIGDVPNSVDQTIKNFVVTLDPSSSEPYRRWLKSTIELCYDNHSYNVMVSGLVDNDTYEEINLYVILYDDPAGNPRVPMIFTDKEVEEFYAANDVFEWMNEHQGLFECWSDKDGDCLPSGLSRRRRLLYNAGSAC